MALANVLSAVRQLILDDEPPAGPVAQRRARLAARFMDLTPAELDDLAAIPPERLSVYTDTIFAGERSLLEWAYPVSLAIIARLVREAGDERPPRRVLFDLVRELHRFRAWASPSVRELAANLEQYVVQQRGDLVSRWPALPELISLERTETEVFYALDDPHAALTAADVEAWRGLSVESLMATPVARASFAVRRSFAHDVLAFVQDWRAGRTDEPPAPRALAAVCGRDVDTLMPAWVRLSPAGAAALDALTPGPEGFINDMATAYIAVPGPGGARESDQFMEFFALLAALAQAGVLRRCAPDPAHA